MADYKKPIPAITADMQPFFDAARRHELVVQRCEQCGTHRFPAREICSNCLSREVAWVKVSGKGEVLILPAADFYPYGYVVRLVALPEAGNYFRDWSGAAAGTTNPLSFAVTVPEPAVIADLAPRLDQAMRVSGVSR